MNISSTQLRKKLYDYIRVADETKLRAIYHLLEEEIETTTDWWKDKELVAELDNRYKSLEDKSDKGFTVEESQASLQKLRKKRNGIK